MAASVINILTPKVVLHNRLQNIENAVIFRIDHIIILHNCHSIVVNKFVVLQKKTRAKTQNAHEDDFDELKMSDRFDFLVKYFFSQENAKLSNHLIRICRYRHALDMFFFFLLTNSSSFHLHKAPSKVTFYSTFFMRGAVLKATLSSPKIKPIYI